MPWWSIFDGERYLCLVALENDRLVGYACSTPFKSKAAYATSVEVSVYLAPEATGQGLGTALYERLLADLGNADLHAHRHDIALGAGIRRDLAMAVLGLF